MVAHIPEILGQGDSCNKDNSGLQDTVQRGIICLYVVRKMLINQIIWVYILMETDNAFILYAFFPLMSLPFFLLLLFISSHSPHICLWTTQPHLTFMWISLKRHCNVTDATLSLTDTMNKDSSYCKMSPSLSNHQNTRVRKGQVLSELSDNCS